MVNVPEVKIPKPAVPAEPEKPKTLWEKVLNYTPVVMTVIATLLAGMSNSELNAAQYDRASAAQLQSKAADQWSFYQAKKIRGSGLDNTLDLLQSLTQASPLAGAQLQGIGPGLPPRIAALREQVQQAVTGTTPGPKERTTLDAALAAFSSQCEECTNAGTEVARQSLGEPLKSTLEALSAGVSPTFVPVPVKDPTIRSAIAAISANKPESEITPLVAAVTPDAWEQAMRSAESNSTGLDERVAPASRALEAFRGALLREVAAIRACSRAVGELARAVGPAAVAATTVPVTSIPATPPTPTPTPDSALAMAAAGFSAIQHEVEGVVADFTGARLRFASHRYELEAPINMEVAQLTEVQVRRSNIEAEHHRTRSRLFFIGMIIAQAAVIGATLALAVRQKSLLWGLAAVAGLSAIAFGIYVRLFA